VDKAVEERAVGQHHRLAPELDAELGFHPNCDVVFHHEAGHGFLPKIDVGSALQGQAPGFGKPHAVTWARGLHMRGLWSGSAFELNHGLVGNDARLTAQGVDFAHNLALATPPMAGLHDIWAMVFMFIVTSSTFEPRLAAAAAASQPAWPAPTTITSYSVVWNISQR
jgi:hypothetical protein